MSLNLVPGQGSCRIWWAFACCNGHCETNLGSRRQGWHVPPLWAIPLLVHSNELFFSKCFEWKTYTVWHGWYLRSWLKMSVLPSKKMGEKWLLQGIFTRNELLWVLHPSSFPNKSLTHILCKWCELPQPCSHHDGSNLTSFCMWQPGELASQEGLQGWLSSTCKGMESWHITGCTEHPRRWHHQK